MIVENLRIIPPPSPIEPDAVDHQADEVETVERRALAIFNSEWEAPRCVRATLLPKLELSQGIGTVFPTLDAAFYLLLYPMSSARKTTIAGGL
jgi:hypothetical protein